MEVNNISNTNGKKLTLTDSLTGNQLKNIYIQLQWIEGITKQIDFLNDQLSDFEIHYSIDFKNTERDGRIIPA